MKLRVYNFINMPSKPHHKEVASPKEAYDYIDREARRQLKMKWIESNCFGLEVFNEADQEWEEWQNEDGGDLDEHAREQGW